ncbi:putative Polysacc_synt_C domain-containing protein [Vibrio chagasii]|nr:putative Polysacc_synt_C domain-containing protein [Vibrio chagasii]
MVAMFQLLVLFFNAVLGFNVNAAIERKYFETNNLEIKAYIGSAIIILILSFLFFFTLMFFLDENVSVLFNIPDEWLYVAICCSFFNFFILIRLGMWQVKESAIKYGVAQLFRTLINFGVSLFFLYIVFKGVDSRVIGIASSTIILAIFSYRSLIKDNLLSYRRVTRSKVIEILNFGAPIVPHVVFNLVLNSVDRVVINKFLGIADVGLYMLAVQLGLIISVFFTSLNKAFLPILFSNLTSGNKRFVNLLYFGLMSLIIISMLVSWFLSPYMVTLFANEKYYAAKEFIVYIFFGQIFSAASLFISNLFLFCKKTKYLSYSSIISGLINIGLLVLLVRLYGIHGAAIAFMSSKLIQMLINLYFFNREKSINWILRVKI